MLGSGTMTTSILGGAIIGDIRTFAAPVMVAVMPLNQVPSVLTQLSDNSGMQLTLTDNVGYDLELTDST